MATTQETAPTSPIGRDTPRVDGPLKVTGQAQYTSDFHFPGHALRRAGRGDDRQRPHRRSSTRRRPRKCPACARSFIARTSARSSARCSGPGFDGIMRRAAAAVRGRCHSLLRPVRRARRGRHVRDRQSRGRCGARHVRRRRSRTSTPTSRRTTSRTWLPRRSACASACKASAATPRPRSQRRRSSSTKPTSRRPRRKTRSSCTRRPRSGTARRLTLYESSQGVVNLQGVLAQMFGLPKENVRVITKFVGSGFGGKLFPWTQCPLAAAAARQLGQAGEARGQPQDDVPDRRPPAAHAAARAARRDARRQARLAPARLRLHARRCSTTTTKTAARRRRSSTACPTSA